MYARKDIVKSLNEFNYFIDEITLNNFIKNWKIEPIYEDEDGIEFFDNMSIAKLKKGISLKSQGFDNSQIIYHVNKLLPEKLAEAEAGQKKEVAPKAQATQVTQVVAKEADGEMKNVTIDITNQTLQMIADSVAEKITSGIKEQIQGADFIKQLLEDSSLKQDNEELSKQVKELLDDNKKLSQRVADLERGKKILPFSFKDLRKFLN